MYRPASEGFKELPEAFLSNLYGGSTPASTSSGSGLYQLGQGYSGSGSNYLTSLGG